MLIQVRLVNSANLTLSGSDPSNCPNPHMLYAYGGLTDSTWATGLYFNEFD
jgi:hypothetical protein